MAWLYKRGGKWWIGWRINGQQFLESTNETDRAAAKKRLEQLDRLAAAQRAGALTEDFYRAATGKQIQRGTVSKFCDDWLAESEGVTTPSTMNKYRQVVREFCEHIGAEKNGTLLEDITAEHVSGFLNEKRQRLAPGTIKGYRRILSSIFLLAQNRGLIKGNPVALAKERGKHADDAVARKRPFTLAELKTLHDKAEPFWQFMIVVGYHTGQSMGDIITMRRNAVDLEQGRITMHRRKTGKQVIIPIGPTVRALLIGNWPKDKDGYFWPDQAARYLRAGSSSFSQEFYELLASAGLVQTRDEKKKSAGKGRDTKRAATILGFHNIRHTFVTHLKISGAVDSVAKELAGHGSSAMSAVYTHLPADTLTKAINLLPEFTTKVEKSEVA